MVRATDIKYFVDPPLNEIKELETSPTPEVRLSRKSGLTSRVRNSKVSRATQQSTTAEPTKVDR